MHGDLREPGASHPALRRNVVIVALTCLLAACRFDQIELGLPTSRRAGSWRVRNNPAVPRTTPGLDSTGA